VLTVNSVFFLNVAPCSLVEMCHISEGRKSQSPG
jgi:hypothetical protein